MKRFLAVLLVMIVATGICFAAIKDPLSVKVNKLYSAPDENSNLVFTIPIDVQMLDASTDGNWYKVKIAFNLGPLCYTYVGWTKIPVGDLLASRQAKVAKTIAPEEISEE
jgi:hypothetical protein